MKELQLDQLKLHGNDENLRRTTMFTTATGLTWSCKSEQQEEDEEVVYLFHLKVKANNYLAPFSVSVTAVLQ